MNGWNCFVFCFFFFQKKNYSTRTVLPYNYSVCFVQKKYHFFSYTFSIFFCIRIFGHRFAGHTTRTDADPSVHIFRWRKNTLDFDGIRLFCTFRFEIQPFVFVLFAFLFQVFEALQFFLFFLFQVFFVVGSMAPETERFFFWGVSERQYHIDQSTWIITADFRNNIWGVQDSFELLSWPMSWIIRIQ